MHHRRQLRKRVPSADPESTHVIHVVREQSQSMTHRGGGNDQVCKGNGLAVRLVGETRDVARGVDVERENAVSELSQDGSD